MRVAFCTHVSESLYESIGASKLVKSIKYFHPDIDMYCVMDEHINGIFSMHPSINWNTIHPFITKLFIDDYDMVVHFDADSMVVDYMDELLDENNLNFDVIGVRNNNDFNKTGVFGHPITENGIPPQEYMNAGLVGITNKNFLDEWCESTLDYGNSLEFKDQSVLNIVSRKYKTRILDTMQDNVYYGISALYGTKTHWDCWKDIQVVSDKLMLNGKVIKVIHQAGGFTTHKLDINLFSEQAQNRILTILN